MHFDAELGDEADPAWAADIDQTIFCDLVQRHDPARMRGLKGTLMRLDGLIGERGSTPREWRASFVRRCPARAARARVLAWEPERLVVAHGACPEENATQILARALDWI